MKRAILGVLLGLVLSSLGFLLAARYVKEPPSVTTYWPIAVGIGATVAAWLLQGTIIALLSRPKLGSVKILDMTRVYLATQAAGAVTPFAGGEIGYQLLELNRRGLRAEDAGAVITIRSMLNGGVLVTAAALGVIFIPEVPFAGRASGLLPSERWILVGTAVAVVVIGSAFAAYRARRRNKKRAAASGRSGSGGRGWRRKVGDYLRNMKNSMALIWNQEPRVLVACLGLMILYWALYPLLGTSALRAAGWNGGGWIYVYVAQFVLFIVIPLAPTPGNSGAAELGFVALMGDYAPHEALLGGVIIWRILNHYSELIIGSFIAGSGLPEDIKIAKRQFGSDDSS